MASKETEETIEAFLKANWSKSPILTENLQGKAPKDGSAYLVLQFPLSETERLPITTPLYRERGGIRILVSVERGGGVKKLREWGEEIAGLFRDRKIGKVNCQVPSSPFTDDAPSDAHWSASIVIPFWRQFTG